MHIEIDTSTVTPGELTALAALIASLRGEPIEARIVSTGFAGLRAPDGFPAPSPVQAVEGKEPQADGSSSSTTDGENIGSSETIDNPAGAPSHDSSGLPWDERIHAASKATNADGTWRARRNTPADLVERVTAELHARSAPSAISAALPPPPLPAPLASEALIAQATSGNVAPPPPPPAAPTEPSSVSDAGSPAAPPPPPADAGMTKPQFIQAVSQSSDPGPSYDALNALAKSSFGVDEFKTIVTQRPDLWTSFLDTLKLMALAS